MSGAMRGNDIALLALERPAKLNPRVQIADLPESDAPCPEGMNLVVSGWGTYIEWGKPIPGLDYYPIMLGAPAHKFLWAVKQKCVDKKYCKKHYARANARLSELYNFTIPYPDSILCVVGPRTGGINGAYKGDSGGTE